MMRDYINDASDRINKNRKDALNLFAEADECHMMLIGQKRFNENESFNTEETRRVADKLITENKYCF